MRTILAAMAAAAAIVLAIGPANAHSFNVALLIGQSGPVAGEGGQIRDGFLLATRERDAHPDEESDGHLGGLDVYLFLLDGADDSLASVGALLAQKTIDILAVLAPDVPIETVRPLAAGSGAILLAPGKMAFPASTAAGVAIEAPAVRAFVTAFKAEFGYLPSQSAARGYNAAKRIDTAARAQGGVADRAALRQALRQSESGIDW
jgi:hypothetical protein